jgi:hypothetical protein
VAADAACVVGVQAWRLTGDVYSTKPGDKPWISEMYGYSFGAAKRNVWHHYDEESMLYPGYMPVGESATQQKVEMLAEAYRINSRDIMITTAGIDAVSDRHTDKQTAIVYTHAIHKSYLSPERVD